MNPSKNRKSIRYVIAKFKFDELPPFEVEYHSLQDVAEKLHLNWNTLNKILNLDYFDAY